jgi:hypothetical protein
MPTLVAMVAAVREPVFAEVVIKAAEDLVVTVAAAVVDKR